MRKKLKRRAKKYLSRAALFLGVLAILSLLVTLFPKAEAQTTTIAERSVEQAEIEIIDLTGGGTPKVYETIVQTAERMGVDPKQAVFIAKCESSLNPRAENRNGEFSVGVFQINLLVHKHISVDEARDVEFATRFFAENWKAKRYSMWYHCSRKLGVL